MFYLCHYLLLQDAPGEVGHLQTQEAEAQLQTLGSKALLGRRGPGVTCLCGGQLVIGLAINTGGDQAGK